MFTRGDIVERVSLRGQWLRVDRCVPERNHIEVQPVTRQLVRKMAGGRAMYGWSGPVEHQGIPEYALVMTAAQAAERHGRPA